MKNLTKVLFLTAVSILLFTGDFDESTQFGFVIITDTEAVVGRPGTPASVAGVRRRTRRRTAAVTAAVVAPKPVVVVPAPAPVVIVKP